MWRLDESDPLDGRPQAVSVSYIEGDRWMAAEERVDNLPLADTAVRVAARVHQRQFPARPAAQAACQLPS
jgi:hypothetical protein